MIRGVVFDLDDTLYFEKDYVKSGFDAVSTVVGNTLNLDQKIIFDFLWNSFLKGIRGDTFDRLLDTFPQIKHKFHVEDLVNIYRYHKSKIELLPEAKKILETLRNKGIFTGIITDGNLHSQMSKIKALDLEYLVDIIIMTDEWGREYWKPHPRGYETIEQKFCLPSKSLCYVADNPEKDFITPKSMGWCTVRFRHYNQLKAEIEPVSFKYSPHFTIDNLEKLSNSLLD